MTKDIRRYELVEDTTPEEASAMKQQMRVEESQRIRKQREAEAKAAKSDD